MFARSFNERGFLICYHSTLHENHRTGEQCSPYMSVASAARQYGYALNGLKGEW